jgi:hypothetical protein
VEAGRRSTADEVEVGGGSHGRREQEVEAPDEVEAEVTNA